MSGSTTAQSATPESTNPQNATAGSSASAGDLTGKTALVTGGSRNIGKEAALALARQGADVVLTYRSRADLAAGTVAEIQGLGRRSAAVRVDLTGTGELDALAAELDGVLADWGARGVDILINNAGVLRLGTFDAITEEDVDVNFATNYKSVLFLTQRLVTTGRLNDGGRVVNLGSGTARIAFAPLVSYGPIKAAVQSLTLYLASFLGSRGITVNAVAPGGLDDDFNATLFDEVFPPARDYIRSNTAVGRIGVPADVGEVVAFLASDAARFVSGAVVPVDGGYHL